MNSYLIKDYLKLEKHYKAKVIDYACLQWQSTLTALYFAVKQNISTLLTANRSNKQLFPTPESPISNSLKR